MGNLHLPSEGSLLQRLKYINWGLVVLITILASVGFTALYSAAGGRRTRHWSGRRRAFAFVFLTDPQ